jgi:uncharacterized membrane protein
MAVSRLTALIATALTSAFATRLLDRERGRRRRALARDKTTRAVHKTGDAVEATARDAWHRAQGVVASVRGRLTRDDASDVVLVERVRARLGTLVSHPSSIDVTATGGRVTLRGPILEREADRLVRRVRRVRGVRGVEDQLTRHRTGADIPGLQGGAMRRSGERWAFAQSVWSPTARMIAGGAGAVLLFGGLRRAGVAGSTAAVTGATLLGRAVTNLELRRLFGIGAGRRAVVIQKAIDVNAPVSDVFDFWSHYENFPRFMSRVREVRRTADGRSRWSVVGPGGVPVEWETEETLRETDRLIAWKTIPGAPVAHSGIVRFEPNAMGGTRIQIRLSYNPPAGALGHGVAALLGSDPKRAMDEDLVRFKSLLEDGRTRAHGQTVRRDALG